MNILRILMPAVIVLALAPGNAAAPAKAAPAAPAAPATAASAPQVERFDDWQKRCFATKSISPCDAFFSTFQKATGVRVASVSVAYAPSKHVTFLQIAVPYGIAIAKGVTVVAGEYKSVPLEIRRCDRTGCFVEGAAAPEFIQALLANSDRKASLDVVADGGKPVSLLFSLKGFSRAYDAMVSAAEQRVNGS